MTIVSDIRVTPASHRDRYRGLLAYASFLLDGRYRVDGCVVRRTRAGHVCLFFPESLSGLGRRHRLIWPDDERDRREIERAVLEAAGFVEEGTR